MTKQFKLTLCKRNEAKKEHCEMVDASNVMLTSNLGYKDELSFDVPVYVHTTYDLVRNPLLDMLLDGYLVKLEYNNYTSYFEYIKGNRILSPNGKYTTYKLFQYTGDFKFQASGGGKLTIVHPDEIVFNPLQSKYMLKSSSILQNIMEKIEPKFTQENSTVDEIEVGLALMKSVNKTLDLCDKVTKLYVYKKDELGNDYLYTVVEDFTPFANTTYMTDDLLNALKLKKTLTVKQQRELNNFTHCKTIHI